MIKNYRAVIPLLLIALLFSCKRKTARWDSELAVPLFTSTLSLQDADKSRIINNVSDSGYTFVYDELIYSAQLAQMKTPDTSINTSFTLARLKLSDKSIVQKITLGDINPLFRLLDGQTTTVPAQDQSNLNPVDIDASAFFETATLDSGYLDISLTNELPVNVKLVVFEIKNSSDGSIVASDSFTDIPTGGSVTKTINLAGKTVEKALKGVIKRLITDPSNGPVLIDANKGVNVTLSVRNLRPRSAVAAFPDQTVLNQNEALSMDMGGAQIKYFKVKAGFLHIKLETTIQENMSMYFAVPSATLNGTMLERNVIVPGAAAGQKEVREEIIDMSGYMFDFRGKNPDVTDTVNTFHQILIVKLDSSGRKVKVTLNDSIRILYSVSEMVPEYAIGYLGNTLNKTGAASSPFTLFNGLDGDIKLDNFNASVILRNYVGAEGRIRINSLEAENTFNGKKTKLTATPLQSDIYVSPPPFLRDAFFEKKVSLDKGNSNIKDFVETLPQLIHYDMDVETNPNGNVSNWKDFVFDNSRVDIFLNVEMPMTFTVGGLTLRDTQEANFSDLSDNQRVKSATIFIDVDNGFPYGVQLDFTLLDGFYNSIGKLEIENQQTILPGKTDAQGRPLSSVKTRLVIQVSKDKIDQLRQAKFIAIKANITGGGVSRKIYNTYNLKIRTNAKFEYEANL